jgi:hypothetical protein
VVREDAVVSLLETAYHATYGISRLRRRLLVSHRALVRFIPVLLTYNRVAGWWLGEVPGADRPSPLVRATFGLLRAVARATPRSASFGLAYPVAPPPWLVEEVQGVAHRFPEQFAGLEAGRLADLPDYNLDTGEVEGPRPTYPLTLRTLRELEREGRAR